MMSKEMTMREAGRRGGKTTAQTHGPEFYEAIGRQGARRSGDLIQAGKTAIAAGVTAPPVASAPQRDLTVREAGAKGGKIVSERYGKDFFSEIGRKGGKQTKERHGADHYSAMGRKGGEANAAKHGPEHFAAIGRKGGGRVRELIAAGLAAQAAEAAEK